jgi:hypothetical protein
MIGVKRVSEKHQKGLQIEALPWFKSPSPALGEGSLGFVRQSGRVGVMNDPFSEIL